MPTSESEPTEAYVWIWLPGASDPVVAGLLTTRGPSVDFTYGESYLARESGISIFEPELPLRSGTIQPRVGDIAGCIADAGPDSWGQRVILRHRFGRQLTDVDDLSVLTFLLESGSNRIGALDFQTSPTNYVSRETQDSTLAELAEAAERLEAGKELSPGLDAALLNGTAIGGARPKALLRDGDRYLIAKFSSSTDIAPMVKWEYTAMELARRAGLRVAHVEMAHALGRDVLLVERFDRTRDGARRPMVSALTILGLTPMTARYGAYHELAFHLRSGGSAPVEDTHELFERISFNILVSNTDDHARNSAAFWNGSSLELTPAYDIAPQPRSSGEATQAMDIGDDGFRFSQLRGLTDRADAYLLSQDEGRAIVDRQIGVIRENWDEVCDNAGLTTLERRELMGRQFLNPYAFEEYEPHRTTSRSRR
jgi:serine/threonine-protein kinase HipA